METENLKGMVPNYIKKSRLKRNQYTLSLLNEGLQVGMLNSQEVYKIQSGLMMLLKDVIRKYTRGESSSVSTEIAENLMASILYAVDAYAFSFEQPESAITDLKTFGIKEGYEKGVNLLNQFFAETKRLYKEIRRSRLDVPVDAYNMTIDEALPLFISKYGIIFDAHHTMASIDYPLAVDDMRLQGIYYIRRYMEHLQTETRFCQSFNGQDLLELLINFGRVCRFDYRIELYNIFELVLSQSAFSILAGGDADQVKISDHQFHRLKQVFTRLNEGQIHSALHEAIDRLQREFNTDPPLTNYIDQCRDHLIQRTIHAAKHNSLEAVIITEKEEKPKPMMLRLHPADRMSDVRLRQLVEEVMRCEDPEGQVQLIRDNFFSLHDYLDLLDSNCLYGDEYQALYKTFDDMELAIFAKIIFYEELRSDPLDFERIVSGGKETDSNWKVHYLLFLQTLNKDRITSIENYISAIDYEEIKF